MRRRGRSWVLLLLGLAAMAVALSTLLPERQQPAPRITITAGAFGTTRSLVARAIANGVTARGVQAELVETSKIRDEIDRVDTGAIDFALVSQAYAVGHHKHVREVTPLYVEALHLLVKAELAAAVEDNLGALAGHTVDLGPDGSSTSGLGVAVLAFGGVHPGEGGFTPSRVDIARLERLIADGDRGALPDAILHLATLPSEIAVHLIRTLDYRLVALPFADAFRLNALLSDDQPGKRNGIELRHVLDAVIPAFTYLPEPPIPAEPLHTIGARLMLVANANVPVEAVETVLATVFSTQIAHVAHPPLERSILSLPPHIPRHDGTLEYLRQDQPYITENTVDTLSSSFSVIGALAGGLLFLWQWWRQRLQAGRDEKFGGCLLRMADIERRMTGLELAATLELEPLVDLQRQVLTLKSDALQEYASGELGSQDAIASLLMPLNALRDHIGDLILHVRGLLEEQAQAEGRSATAVWTDAIDHGDKADGD